MTLGHFENGLRSDVEVTAVTPLTLFGASGKRLRSVLNAILVDHLCLIRIINFQLKKGVNFAIRYNGV